MNAFPFKIYCDVCGGEGVGNARASAAMWLRDATVAHSDPRICRDVLEQKKRELDKLADQIKETT